jgi:DNA mismatch repair protein MutS
LAEADVLLGLAHVAERWEYVRPELVDDAVLDIRAGRHPVVERLLQGERFVPNDLALSAADRALLIVTGPNMAGKSTLLRQAALITIMAQMGSFVPAAAARIGVADRSLPAWAQRTTSRPGGAPFWSRCKKSPGSCTLRPRAA